MKKITFLIFFFASLISYGQWTLNTSNIRNTSSVFDAMPINVLETSGGEIRVVFKEGDSDRMQIWEYNGSWSAGPFLTNTTPLHNRIENYDDEEYILYVDSGKLSVQKYNGTSFVQIGATQFSNTSSSSRYNFDIAIDSNGIVYVAYRDSSESNKISVMKYDSGVGSWQDVGSDGFTNSEAFNISLDIDANNDPYVAFADSDASSKFSVMKFDAGSGTWGYLGSAGFSAGTTGYGRIAIAADNTPYVAYVDQANSNYPTVQRFNGTSWELVGIAGFAGVAAATSLVSHGDQISIVINGNTPYLNFGTTSLQMYSYMYNGSGWTALSNPVRTSFRFGTSVVSQGKMYALGLDRVSFDEYATLLQYSLPNTAPVVSTSAASSIMSTSATLGGNVTADGGATITERGFVYSETSTNSDPVIMGTGVTKQTVSGTTGVFDFALSGLTANTQYSYKAYATNSEGTSYGSVVNFTTPNVSTTFTGTGDWTTGTWSNGIPSGTEDVIVDGDLTIDVATAITANLTVNASRTLIINGGSGLTVNGDFTNSGTVTANSGSSIRVSGNATGDITYKRILPTSNWYLISSPVSNETVEDYISNHLFIAVGTNDGNHRGLGFYSNDGSGWDYYTTSSTGPLNQGQGYTTKMLIPNVEATFTGGFPTTDVNRLIFANANAFNLIGNPYPSYIPANSNADAVNNILDINTARLSEETVWFWDQSIPGYTQVNQASGARYIAPGQGFFVSASGTPGNFSFTEAMQSHQSSEVFNRNTNTRPEIKLVLTDGTQVKETEIYYIEGTTTGWDNGYDSSIFNGLESDFELYTHSVSDSQGRKLGIQSLPDSNYENMIIPIGIKASAGVELSFSFDVKNFPEGMNVYLEDKTTSTFTQLDQANATYSTTLSSDIDGIGRFYLHTSTQSLNANEFELDNISIYTTSERNLRVVGIHSGKANLEVYNILGGKVFSNAFDGRGVDDMSLPSSLRTGIYIVKLETSKGELVKKIIIQ